MEDLNGLDWSLNGKDIKKPAPTSSSLYSAMRSTPPLSGRSTPFAGAASTPSSKPSTPANDSFANLVSFNSTANNKNLSLQDQQKRLAEQKAQQEAARAKQVNAQFGAAPDQFWDNLGSGRSTPATNLGPSPGAQQLNSRPQVANDDEDILAAFNSAAPVDSSSHFPKPIATPPPANLPQSFPAGSKHPPASNASNASNFDDDDPFNLSQLASKQRQAHAQEAQSNDDDDVLGLLGRPVSKRPATPPEAEIRPSKSEKDISIHPQEQAIAELVDMGFPPDKARRALEATESGLDVQAAVGWLLNQAHEETKQRSKTKSANDRTQSKGPRQEPPARARDDEGAPSWLQKEGRPDSTSRRRDDETTPSERDPAQMASEFGNTLFKTAGSLWKQGQKRMQQAVQELNNSDSGSGSSTPKWMREPSTDGRDQRSTAKPSRERQQESNVTDEALMLESDRARPAPRQPQRPRDPVRQRSGTSELRDHSPAMPSKLRQQETQPAFVRRQESPPVREQSQSNGIKSSLSRQALEEQAASAYKSSARRRKPPPQQPTASEPDLLDASASLAAARPATTTPVSSASRPIPATATLPSRPRSTVPSRIIPKVPSNVMTASNNHRDTGTTHFKRGDFAAAHASYTSALSQIPTTHPITIVILTNHALTALRIGEPKTALNDANNAITVIGSGKGEAETITVSASEPPKPMRDFYGKALMRKAEALEQMEKWTEAAAAWREAVDGNHGGDTSRQGRTRCEKAAGITKPKPPSTLAAASRPAAVRKTASAPPKPAVPSQASAVAISKLREANAAAERIDDERFALADSVEAKVNAWKGGKPDNLRALLASLDTVLWPEAGWKKVGMAELVLPNKVKIQYMKGISKVHPDKVCHKPRSTLR